jgi:hypothetical protein
MRLNGFFKRWSAVVLWIIATISFAFTTFEFARKYIYTRDNLQATVIGEVDELLPPDKRDRFSLRVAVVNAGTREAALTHAELVALRREGEGYAWVRIFPPVGLGFEARTFKPGEIAIVSIVTDGYGQKYFTNVEYSRPIDDAHHEFVLGLRTGSMDADGRIYTAIYPINEFKIRNDFAGGPGPPSEGYTCHSGPHQLLIDTAGRVAPPGRKEYACVLSLP